MLAERGVALVIIRALAGHVDFRTTRTYVVINRRKAESIAGLERHHHPLTA
jgi:site-specific recombinase XerD